MNRKDFIKTSCAICGLGVAGMTTFLQSCKKTSTDAPAVNFTLDLTSSANAALTNVGGYVYNSGVIVAKTAASTYTALSQACTHQGCTVSYTTSGNKFSCPCHGGTYDVSGNVLSGPPPSALKKYTITQSGNILTVKG